MRKFTRLTNTQYDVIKWLIINVAPALILAITATGTLLEYDVTIIVGLISIVTTFFGTILGISTRHYEEDKDGHS